MPVTANPCPCQNAAAAPIPQPTSKTVVPGGPIDLNHPNAHFMHKIRFSRQKISVAAIMTKSGYVR